MVHTVSDPTENRCNLGNFCRIEILQIWAREYETYVMSPLNKCRRYSILQFWITLVCFHIKEGWNNCQKLTIFIMSNISTTFTSFRTRFGTPSVISVAQSNGIVVLR